MERKNKQKESNRADGSPCCRVEAVVSVDERGQMVLPKEIRDKAEIVAGDKLAVVSWMAGEKLCCISLMKTVFGSPSPATVRLTSRVIPAWVIIHLS